MERWTYDSRRRGASDLAGKDAIACFYEEGWQDGNCILIRDYRWRLFLWFCYDWGGKRYISEREKELYRSVFSAYFIYYAVYCVFSSFIVLFLTEQGYSATVCGIITSLTFLANLLMEPVGGYITDTFLPTRRYLLVCIGIVSMVCAFCTKFMEFSHGCFCRGWFWQPDWPIPLVS